MIRAEFIPPPFATTNNTLNYLVMETTEFIEKNFERISMNELILRLEKLRELCKEEQIKESDMRFVVSFNGFSKHGVNLEGLTTIQKIRAIFPK